MNLTQLQNNLETLPSQIRDQELLVIEAKNKLEEAKVIYEAKFAFEIVASKGENAQEKKAKAILASDEKKRNVLKANLEYERKNTVLTYLNNQFNAIRKLANLFEKTYSAEISGN
jgi:hypothetical protein